MQTRLVQPGVGAELMLSVFSQRFATERKSSNGVGVADVVVYVKRKIGFTVY